jgi:methylase of polypeptide subunit release factors
MRVPETIPPVVQWDEAGSAHSASWLSDAKAPQRIIVADDTLTADAAFRLAAEGAALLWRGDFQNARQLLQAMGRRLDARLKASKPKSKVGDGGTASEQFHRYRMAQAQRARTLGQLLIPLAADYSIPLRRAPEVAVACTQAYGPAPTNGALLSLRELQGAIGAYEWQRKGVPVTALGASVHPHYGVFAPVRSEYVDLVAKAPLPANCQLACDIGTGTGVLAAVLAKRGVPHIVATDSSPRALACAKDNLSRLGLADRVTLIEADLYAAACAPANLIVCNPPWLPGKAGSLLEHAVYDPDSHMLRGFLAGAKSHLAPNGEAWLILSDLAEHLGLRTRDQLLQWITTGGLQVLARIDTRPTHKRVSDADDPLHTARAAEITSLWRLGSAN